MTDLDIRARLHDPAALALTMWGEARGEAIEARLAVGNVVRNRARFPSKYRAVEPTIAGVCLAPRQFSCWNGDDSNGAAVMAQAEKIVLVLPMIDRILQECLYLADGLIAGVLRDNTKGATFYLERDLYQEQPPSWAKHLVKLPDIGPFVLFTEPSAKMNL